MSEKILVIEDEKETLHLLSFILRREGYEVITAESGQEGLDKVRKEKPDLVISDIMLPGLDGWKVLSTLKTGSATADLPVIIASSMSQVANVERAFQEGASAFIAKPFTPERIRSKVTEILEKTRQSREKKTGILQKIVPF